jgi:hypothetical protein
MKNKDLIKLIKEVAQEKNGRRVRRTPKGTLVLCPELDTLAPQR